MYNVDWYNIADYIFEIKCLCNYRWLYVWIKKIENYLILQNVSQTKVVHPIFCMYQISCTCAGVCMCNSRQNREDGLANLIGPGFKICYRSCKVFSINISNDYIH